MTIEESSTNAAPQATVTQKRGSRRRRTWVIVAAVAAVLLIVGGVQWARFAPLATGTLWGWPTSSTDAWQLEHAFLETDYAVIVRNEHQATLTLQFSIYNTSRFAIEIIDAQPVLDDLRESIPSCFWHPQSVRFEPPSWYDDNPGTELEPPFALRSEEEVVIELTGVIGPPEGPPCQMAALSWVDVDIPVRYSVLGVHRTQQLPLDLVIGITDDPEEWLELDVDKLEAD